MNKTYNGEWPYTINLPNLKINNLQLKVGLYIPVRHQFHTVLLTGQSGSLPSSGLFLPLFQLNLLPSTLILRFQAKI